jgi:TPR repeat protein
MTRDGAFGLGLLVTLSACGAGSTGEAVRPNDPTYGAASGDKGGAAANCKAIGNVGAEGQPLVVDWEAEQRADLEAAMRKGVAVVHYDCGSLRVLNECQIAGNYGFTGTTVQEKVLSLSNADEAAANLPVGGAKIGASLARDSSLDIALVIIGKHATAQEGLRASLTGKCDGATHYVRGAWLGAFAMKTSTKGEVAATADVFGFAAKAGSSSVKGVSNKSGDLAACHDADPEAPKPPKACGGPLRIDLMAITDAKPTKDENKKGLACPTGMVATGDKCSLPAPDVAHSCAGLDGKDCLKQCNAKDLASCSTAALLYDLGVDLPLDHAKEAALLRHGCEDFPRDMLGVQADMCGRLASLYYAGDGVPKDMDKAKALQKKACYDGDRTSCRALGMVLVQGSYGTTQDKPRGMAFLLRACNGGDATACNEYTRRGGVRP